ncbi:hypothetical protein ES707_19218 [subsurface metagenome]
MKILDTIKAFLERYAKWYRKEMEFLEPEAKGEKKAAEPPETKAAEAPEKKVDESSSK